MENTLRRPLLRRYTEAEETSGGPDRFGRHVAAWLAVCLGIGLALSLPDVARRPEFLTAERCAVTIEMTEYSLPEPAREPEPEPEPVVPVLEPETVLAQPVDQPIPEPEVRRPAPVATLPTESLPPAQPVKRVYGVRRVYARGLGSGSESGSLVSKQGNTVDGKWDDLQATEADLQGELAALSSVEQAPEPLHRVRPIYSAALTKARAEGVVEAYLLVDSDGKVRDVKIVQEFGFDSAVVAESAFRKFEFRPARRGGKSVAVWILHRIRFKFQE